MGVGGVGGGGDRGGGRSGGADRGAGRSGGADRGGAGRSGGSSDAGRAGGVSGNDAGQRAGHASGGERAGRSGGVADVPDSAATQAESQRRTDADRAIGNVADVAAPAADVQPASRELSVELERGIVEAHLGGAQAAQPEAVAAEVPAIEQRPPAPLAASSLEASLSAQLDAEMAAVNAAAQPAVIEPVQTEAHVPAQAEVQAPVDAVQVETPAVDGALAAAQLDAEVAAVNAVAQADAAQQIAAELDVLAATNPVGAAEQLTAHIQGATSPEMMAEIVGASQGAIETMGVSAAGQVLEQREIVDGVFAELSGAYETLRANGLPEQATIVAEAFGAGYATAPELHGVAAREFARSVGTNVLEHRSPHFAADAVIGASRAIESIPLEGRQLQQLDFVDSAASVMGNAVDTVAMRNREPITRYNNEIARMGEVFAELEGALPPDQIDARVQEMMAARTDELRAANDAALSTINAVDAGARLAAELQLSGNEQLNYGVARAASQIRDAALTPDGQAALTSIVAQQVDGQTTMFDNLAAMPQDGMIAGTREALFDAFSAGAASVGTNALAHQDFERYAALGDVVERNAGRFLGSSGRRLAAEVAGAMRQVGQLTPENTADLLTRVSRAGNRLGGDAAAANLGALTALSGAPNAVPVVPNAPNGAPQWVGTSAGIAGSLSQIYGNRPELARTFAAAGLAANLAAFNPRELGSVQGVIGALSTANDAIAMYGDLTGRAGLVSATDVGGRVLGGAGAAFGLMQAMRQGNGADIAANGLSLVGALAGNPYIGLGVGAAQLAHAAYTGIVNENQRERLRGEFFESQHFDPSISQFIQENHFSRDLLAVARERAPGLGQPAHEVFAELASLNQHRARAFDFPQQVEYAELLRPIDSLVFDAAAQSAAHHSTHVRDAYAAIVEAMRIGDRAQIAALVPGIDPHSILMTAPAQ